MKVRVHRKLLPFQRASKFELILDVCDFCFTSTWASSVDSMHGMRDRAMYCTIGSDKVDFRHCWLPLKRVGRAFIAMILREALALNPLSYRGWMLVTCPCCVVAHPLPSEHLTSSRLFHVAVSAIKSGTPPGTKYVSRCVQLVP